MYRTGIGYDLHKTATGRRLVLGGVEIAHEWGLLGHSDADVVLHALCDALLGAAGLPDIGDLFPDTDEQFKDADSRTLLRNVLDRVARRGFVIENVDVIIHAQRPRLTPHKDRIRDNLARLLGLPAEAVGVKAKTNEGVDAVGRQEAVACWTSVLLRSAAPR